MRSLLRGGRLRRTSLTYGLAAALAGAVGFVPIPAGAGSAEPCQRLVWIESQRSAGEGAGTVVFTVRTAGCAAAGGVDYTVTSDTAGAGVDYHAVGGTLEWAARDLTRRRITVALVPDAQPEDPLETFDVQLGEPSPGVSVVVAAGQGRIIDDDRPALTWAVDDPPCTKLTPNQLCRCSPQLMHDPISVDGIEHVALDRTHDVTLGETVDVCVSELSLSAPLPEPAQVTWRTADGNAIPGKDYVPVPQREIAMPVGASVAELPVQIVPRPPDAPAAWFTIRVDAVSPGVLADAVAVVTLPAT